jgi:hypothetical protein
MRHTGTVSAPAPIRYDLVHDFGRCLVEKGLLTREQLGEAEVEWLRILEEGSCVPRAEILVRRGWVSRDQVASVRRSLTTFVPLPDPLDPEAALLPPACVMLTVILEMAVLSAATALRFRPSGKEVQISHFVDGEWYEMTPLLHRLFEDLRGLLERTSRDGRLLVRAQSRNADVAIRPFAPGQEELRLDFEYPPA